MGSHHQRARRPKFVHHRRLASKKRNSLGRSPIYTLSDDVLLCIFDFYRLTSEEGDGTWSWHDLVQVCQRWRRVVFGYPSNLNLQLECNSRTDVEAALNIWPLALPIFLQVNFKDKRADEVKILGALERHRDRMSGICLWGFRRSQLKKCITLMQEQFPVLRSLDLGADKETMFVTDAFLGGSAPLLQKISLGGNIRFPGLPKLLSSTRDLVDLNLRGIPMTDEGHIPPDAMATCLSVLNRLRSLTIAFLRQKSSSYPTDQHPPPSTYTVLPALTYLWLEAPHGYLEDLVGRVDAPLLDSGHLDFYDEPIFDTPRVPQFFHRTIMFKLFSEVTVWFRRVRIFFEAGIFASFRSSIGPATFSFSFPCSEFPAQVATMERICSQWPSLFSHVELLRLNDDFIEQRNWSEANTTAWLEFLRSFNAVQTLRLGGTATELHVAYILGLLKGERATEVLPALCTINSNRSDPGASDILGLSGPFLAARKESGHPVVVTADSKY